MAEQRKLQIVIEAVDRASAVMDKAAKKASSAGEKISAALDRAKLPSAALAGGLAFGAKSVLEASSQLEGALMGLARVATAVGESEEEAKRAAQSLASDGLMSVKDASEGLKNLLATGFNLPEAIRLMNAFRDSAAYNREGTLGFGEAIVGATQGIKNQKSIMVDNAGITKNLSVILKEAGLSVNDLANVTTDATVRAALFNGILKEAAIFEGDAAVMADTYAGSLAQLETDIFNAKAALGDELKPVMRDVLGLVSDMVKRVKGLTEWFKENKSVAIILAGGIAGALVPAFVGLAAAGGAAALALAPFFLTGAAFVGLVHLIDMLSKRYTGYGLLDQIKAGIELIQPLIDKLLQKIDELHNKITSSTSRLNVFNQAKSALQLIDNALLGKQHGGMIPGHPNQPVPAILHGGERIVSRTGVDVGGGSSNGVVINFNGDMSVRSDQDITILAQEISRILGKQSEYARIGVGA